MDDVDNAQIHEEQTRERGIHNAVQQLKEVPLIINGKRVCLDCENEINPKRVEAVNAVRCEFCQPYFEKRSQR